MNKLAMEGVILDASYVQPVCSPCVFTFRCSKEIKYHQRLHITPALNARAALAALFELPELQAFKNFTLASGKSRQIESSSKCIHTRDEAVESLFPNYIKNYVQLLIKFIQIKI